MKRFTAFAFVLTLALPIAARANDTDEKPRVWWLQVTDQAVKNLESDNFSVREQGIKNVIYLARVHGDELSLDAAEASLVEILDKARRPGTKKLALAALQALGSDAVLNVSQRSRADTEQRIENVLSEYVASAGPTF